MKSTGIVRKIDDLGRVVIPVELRRTLDIEIKDPIEIFTDDNGEIILKKYAANQACVITGTVSPNNKTYGHNKIILSPEGVRLLMKELEDAQLVK
ncbi:AbrB/MazE/SpoVT family DNA-binding domain-containing protein [Fictibacillus sp. 7GRE50]|uniref:AbrB/MazE/SpoVT family DNA-binding domain-containing protein n=1 Tax=Fictibacillus sp. 7GRE50 TaxID=2745878 RepID=UPI0018CDC27C|nr:AbrB/MazE/SpoVT family DNA-binding domain-containing protein [Fictibacillus sp. 7GRE50]MBH0167189.1 AbrB/MazE/SpoVT family DNA-binding domain-containing protein [Fictibacillus sp. 7GRE50]